MGCFAEHYGDCLTHMVLDADTLTITYCSAIWPMTLKSPNQRLVAAGGEEAHQPHSKILKLPASSTDDGSPTKPDIPTVFIRSRHDDGPTSTKPLPEFNADDLVGRFPTTPWRQWGEIKSKSNQENG